MTTIRWEYAPSPEWLTPKQAKQWHVLRREEAIQAELGITSARQSVFSAIRALATDADVFTLAMAVEGLDHDAHIDISKFSNLDAARGELQCQAELDHRISLDAVAKLDRRLAREEEQALDAMLVPNPVEDTLRRRLLDHLGALGVSVPNPNCLRCCRGLVEAMREYHTMRSLQDRRPDLRERLEDAERELASFGLGA